MIFVTVGTQDKKFTRLLKCIEDNIRKGVIKEKVVVQSGYTDYKSSAMKIIPFMDKELFTKYIKEADLIITHGGVGTILEAIKYHKKIIGVARLSKYMEHVNDHQVQLLTSFSKSGYLIYMDKLEHFAKYYEKARSFEPKEYVSNKDNFNEELNNYMKLYLDEGVECNTVDTKLEKIIKQAFKFFLISGIGWLIDMCIYTILTNAINIKAMYANIFSSIIAVTYVYITSTRKTFINNSSKRNLKNKYMYYIFYQICIILISSTIIGMLANYLSKVTILIVSKYHKILAKIIFTPVTMICNFIFMKWLIEKF